MVERLLEWNLHVSRLGEDSAVDMRSVHRQSLAVLRPSDFSRVNFLMICPIAMVELSRPVALTEMISEDEVVKDRQGPPRNLLLFEVASAYHLPLSTTRRVSKYLKLQSALRVPRIFLTAKDQEIGQQVGTAARITLTH